jgi:M6 family metalloprotease-like protein
MKNTHRIFFAGGIVIAFLLLALLPALALEPPTREQIARYRLDGTLPVRVAKAKAFGNHKIPQRVQNRLGYKLNRLAIERGGLTAQQRAGILAPPQAWKGMPTTGTVRILALLVSFSDYPGVTAPSTFASRLFGDGVGGPPSDSLRDFYLRSSYNQLTIDGDVLGWYQTSYARSEVAPLDSEYDAGALEAVIEEALNYYDAQGHDFTQYDNDGDGAIDYLCVFWTGPHGEWSTFWWGYYAGFTDSAYRLDGKRLTNFSWQWELYNYPSGAFSPDVIIHETGHALGVPDYYDYDDTVGPDGGVGGLDIMDGSGDHNCFSKFMLDWITPTVVSGGSQTLELRASGLYPDAVLFMPGAEEGEIFGEFFMVQNRYRSGNDTGLFTLSDGLLIWHVDARLDGWNWNFLYDNSYTSHKLLRLMEADGLEEIETYSALANAGDYYKAGASFGQFSSPNSARYDGTPTAMGVTAISGAATPMSLTVFSSNNPPVVEITNIIEGQTVYGTVPVEVSASDNDGISRVELYIGTTLVQTLTAAPYSFLLDMSSLSNKAYTIKAVAYDTILQTSVDTVSVVVDNIFAPLSLKAVKAVNRSLLLREYVNVLTWSDNYANKSVLKYRIYRVAGGGRTLVAEVAKSSSGTSYRYIHRGISRTETYTYEVVAVGDLDREGLAATATAT